MKTRLFIIGLLAIVIPALIGCQTTGSQPSNTSAAAQIDREVDAALIRLYDTVPSAKVLAEQAKGILVFPSIVKGGFVVGAQYGRGALREAGRTVGYYTVPLRPRMVFKPGSNRLAMRCFSWTMPPFPTLTAARAGRSASVPASWSWTMERPRRLRPRHLRTMFTPSSFTNKV